MKKILMCLCASVLMTSNASANNLQAQDCYVWGKQDVFMTVFFDNNSYVLPTLSDCENAFKTELSSVISGKSADDITVAVIASTSASGDYKYNIKLSDNRANTIKNIISTINPNIEVYSYSGGEADAQLKKHNVNNPDDRAVVIWFSAKDSSISNNDRNLINTLHTKLKSYDFIGAKRNVWKNNEGKFNTARLISDSVAGVVLGTAGGLITSSVVKKNQLEDGFEDIKCTIGGQTVSRWGDEFTVGIK